MDHELKVSRVYAYACVRVTRTYAHTRTRTHISYITSRKGWFFWEEYSSPREE